MADKKTARIAVLGAGHWGRNLIRNLNDLGVLELICETDLGQRNRISCECQSTRISGEAAAAFRDPHIDAVAIATPAATHGALVRQALDAGKDVFVEKPLCLDVVEAEELKALADRRGRILMVGHLLLYHPAFQALHQTVSRGELGKLRYVYSNRASLGKIRREENALWSFAPHDISMILQLASRMPRRVVANGAHHLTDGVADITLSHLDFGAHLQAHIFVSWLHPYKEHRLVVVGEKAMAVFNDAASGADKLLLYRHQAEWKDDLPVVNKADAEPIPYEEAEPLRRECEAFLQAILRRAEPPSTASEGVRVLRVLDACERALQSGEPVVLSVEETV